MILSLDLDKILIRYIITLGPTEPASYDDNTIPILQVR